MMADARVFWPQIIALSMETSVQIAPVFHQETVDAVARTVLEQAPARFALAGHGLGAIVAMEVLRQDPARITKLVLISTTCQQELPNLAASREPLIAKARAGRLAQAIEPELTCAAAAPGPDQQELVALAKQMAFTLGTEVFIRQSRMMQRRPDQQSTLRRAKTPTLVICGEHDIVYPVRRHEFMAHLMPNAQLEVVGETAHYPMLERPDHVTGVLRDWLGL
ncbi:Hydrolase, alpha/beta hydrolase fold family [Candidatus Rhodobacter oscarellae]|uniref:Hydrolase, alpha/beta hydrolase fold family n=2 Tax=Candidatus Rhodobacter oscarellae TaxID=1675527 RepID=A0A0J9GWP8_9RHOB|nr:Hydrolase, alpha/beta hydrolase fold family [Candidatus Rhodobacter lobularis]